MRRRRVIDVAWASLRAVRSYELEASPCNASPARTIGRLPARSLQRGAMPMPQSDISLRREKDLARVGIFHRCPGAECVNIDVTAVRRERTRDESFLARNGNPIRKVFLAGFRHGRSRRRPRITFVRRRACRWRFVRFRLLSRMLAIRVMRRSRALRMCEHVLERAEKLLEWPRLRR
jgi:hypothetical protein